jgi:hypothetical protein
MGYIPHVTFMLVDGLQRERYCSLRFSSMVTLFSQLCRCNLNIPPSKYGLAVNLLIFVVATVVAAFRHEEIPTEREPRAAAGLPRQAQVGVPMSQRCGIREKRI